MAHHVSAHRQRKRQCEGYRRRLPRPYQDALSQLKCVFERLFAKTKRHAEAPERPSEAPSSLAVYTAAAIPGWQNSLLLPALKHGKLLRLRLNAAGTRIEGDTLTYFNAPVRYRDVALSPDGTRLYLATDSASVSSGPSKEDPKGTSCKGCILEFTYQRGGQPAPAPGRPAPAAPRLPGTTGAGARRPARPAGK